MRLRRRKFRAAVVVQPGDYPIAVSFGPGYCFESSIDEATRFATELIDAIDEARRGGDAC